MRYVCKKEEESLWDDQRSGGQQEQRHISGGEELWHCSVRGGRGDIVRICPTLDSHLRRTIKPMSASALSHTRCKELERIIKLSGIGMSVENIAEIKKGTLETHPFQILCYEKIIFHG